MGKKKMLQDLDGIKVKLLKSGKADTKAAEKKAKEIGGTLAEEAAKAAGDTFVGVVDAGAFDDAKALNFAMEVAAKKCDNKAICLLSNAGGKLAVLAVVPASLAGKVSAKAWTG